MIDEYTLTNFIETKYQTLSPIPFKILIDRQLKHWSKNLLPSTIKFLNFSCDVYMTYDYEKDKVEIECYIQDEETFYTHFIFKEDSLMMMLEYQQKFKIMLEDIINLIESKVKAEEVIEEEDFNVIWYKHYDSYKKGYMDIFKQQVEKIEIENYEA